MMDLDHNQDQNLFPSTASFDASFDVGVVINDYHHLRGEGGRVLIKELHP